MEQFFGRMIRAMRLEPALYEEVEADRGATGQALGVVALSSLAAGIGGLGHDAPFGLVIGIVSAMLGWIVWAGMIYLVGTKLLPEPTTQTDVGELLRTTGFAAAPGVLRVAGGIPFLGGAVSLVAAVWMLVAFVIAVRQALDYSGTGRAVLVCVIGMVAYVAIIGVSTAVLLALAGGAAALAS